MNLVVSANQATCFRASAKKPRPRLIVREMAAATSIIPPPRARKPRVSQNRNGQRIPMDEPGGMIEA